MNLKKLLVYRASFFISLVLMSMWVLAYFTLIEVIFLHTKMLAGWGKGEVLLIMSFYYLIQNVSDIFFKDDFEHFGEVVRRGELDLKLVKPAPARLLVFFWEIRFDHAAGLIVTAVLFLYALQTLTIAISPPFLAFAFFLSGISLLLYFSILSLIGTLVFWIQRNDTFNVLIFNVSQLSRYPRQIYRHIIGKILTFGIPLALIATVPAEVALKFDHGYLTIFFIGITTIFYLLSHWFWHYGLKKYTSAN